MSDSVVSYGVSAPNYSDQVSDGDYVQFHSISVDGLAPDTEYHFQVCSSDAQGNDPVCSADRTFHTYLTPCIDPNCFILEGPYVSGIQDTTVHLEWTTDLGGNSQVYYGLETGVYTEQKIVDQVRTNHHVQLNAVLPQTLYYFYVCTETPDGQVCCSDEFEFYTTSAPDTEPPLFISGPNVDYISDSRAVITWETDEISNSTVHYGQIGSYTSIITDSSFVIFHSITLTNLDPGISYQFYVESQDPSGNSASSIMKLPLFSSRAETEFTTSVTGDTTAPVFLSTPNPVYISDTLIIMQWETNELSNGKIMADIPGTSGPSIWMDKFQGTHHTVYMTQLPGEKHRVSISFDAASEDIHNNIATWGPGIVETGTEDSTAPVISNVNVSINDNNALITWETNESSDSHLRFSTRYEYDGCKENGTDTIHHQLVLTHLQYDETYNVKIYSIDPQGNQSNDELLSFTTAEQVLPSIGFNGIAILIAVLSVILMFQGTRR